MAISAQLAATHRLLRKDGFGHVMRAETIADKQFKIFFAPNRKNHARLGIIASKRILPTAVRRNRLKRVIREIFRKHNIRLFKLDLVVMIKSDFCRVAHIFPGSSLERLLSQVENKCAGH